MELPVFMNSRNGKLEVSAEEEEGHICLYGYFLPVMPAIRSVAKGRRA